MFGFLRRRPPVFWLTLALALTAATYFGASRLERGIQTRILSEAARHGLEAHVEAVRLGFWPLVRIEGLRVSKLGVGTVTLASAACTLPLSLRGLLGHIRLALGPTVLTTAPGLTVDARPTAWEVAVVPNGWRAELLPPPPGLAVKWAGGAPSTFQAEVLLSDLPAGNLVRMSREDSVLLDLGRVSGILRLSAAPGGPMSFGADLASQGLRIATLASTPAAAPTDPDTFGLPTDMTLRLEGSWSPGDGKLDLAHWSVAMEGALASGSLLVTDLPKSPRVDLALEVERVDFARLLSTSGLASPDVVAADASGKGALGSASLKLRVMGRLADAASFSVSQRLDFTPPGRPLPALEKLRGDFVHQIVGAGGAVRAVQVSKASPDFVSLSDVPPLLVRTLLLAEDSGFFGHRGVDLSEVPSALITNWMHKGPTRGASTITQQLAKNLFFSHEKRVGRKLQELATALLLETTLGKERILEIYLNVIEWGPDLYGLGPAARRYFGKEPRELSPAQNAFLVALIPGPLKYQRSFAEGRPSPGFRPLIDDLLAKLRSVDALSEDQYRAALAEDIVIQAAPGSP